MRKYEYETLYWVNELIAKYNLGEPLEALPPDTTREEYVQAGHDIARCCPVAKALGVPCGTGRVKFGDHTEVGPNEAMLFMMDHDDRTMAVRWGRAEETNVSS